MAEEIKQAIDDQINNRDPFQMARQKADSNVLKTAEAFGPQGNPLDASMPLPGVEEQVPDKAPGLSLGTALAPAPGQIADFQKSDLPQLLTQSGLGDLSSRLSFTPLGKFQLEKELQQKFGPEFRTNPEAVKILEAFLSQLGKQDKRAVDDELTAMTSRGKRTLNALLGGI